VKGSYYNENDPQAAAWLNELIKEGLICPGYVDQRSIEEIEPDELEQYDQCHFFAGIGVWSYAIRNAGWSDNTPVWTGSCPCQSFSASGKRGGFDDKRHLWPAWFRLIEKCRPDVIFGEQVASKDGLAWFDVVSADLERSGYAVGAADLCAAGLGAPHIRQRLFFVAESNGSRSPSGQTIQGFSSNSISESGSIERLADATSGQFSEQKRRTAQSGEVSWMGNPEADGHQRQPIRTHGESSQRITQAGITNGFWRDAEWIYCRDQKYRPVEPGTFPLVTGASARVGRLRGYGNSIVAPCAQAFIEAWIETR
jgi:DNA (cytosine-5)-methyltransferase 1